jgi:glycine cleavage system H protein
VEIAGCSVPDDRLYDLEHDVWVQPEPGGTATLGLLGPLVWFAGPFLQVSFRDFTGPVAPGRSIATVESARYTGAVRLPIEAEVAERNRAIVERPRLLNDAPYGDGWVARLRPRAAVGPGTPGLATAAGIAAALEGRIRAQRIRCWPQFPDAELYEIGIECSAILTLLNEELARRPAGTALLLVTDDPTSPIEMVRWSDQTGHALLAHRAEGTLHQFLVRKEAHPEPRRRRPGA